METQPPPDKNFERFLVWLCKKSYKLAVTVQFHNKIAVKWFVWVLCHFRKQRNIYVQAWLTLFLYLQYVDIKRPSSTLTAGQNSSSIAGNHREEKRKANALYCQQNFTDDTLAAQLCEMWTETCWLSYSVWKHGYRLYSVLNCPLEKTWPVLNVIVR